MAKQEGIKVIAVNRKARHNYEILETFEAGIELTGTEVKSIRQGELNLSDSYAVIRDGEIFLVGMHINPYEQGNRFNQDPVRTRRLLMHKREIMKLLGSIQQKGLTLVPMRLYFKNSLVKVELGLARGKKLYDKRQSAKERSTQQDIDQALKQNHRNFLSD